MILEQETYEKFGYYPCDLSPKSSKKVLAACDDCGKVRAIQKGGYRALCRSCWQKCEKVKRICEACGKEFEVYPSVMKYGRGKFCSRQCANGKGEKSLNWKGGLVKRICKTCEKTFEAKPSNIKWGGAKFCSLSCVRKKRVFPTHHTKPERIFEAICKKYNLPFKYTGDGSFWIQNINPDFVEVNGKKIAVEIFGDYWHSPLLRYNIGDYQRADVRATVLKKYGWKLIVFWESDLKREDAEAFVLSTLEKKGVS